MFGLLRALAFGGGGGGVREPLLSGVGAVERAGSGERVALPFGPDTLLSGLGRQFLGLGAEPGQLLLVERQAQVHARPEVGLAFGRGGLHEDAGLLLVEQVHPFVEVDASDVESQLPETPFRLRERYAHDLRDDREAVPVAHADVERHAGADLGFEAARLRHGLLPAVLFEDVVGGQVGAVDQLVDLQPGHLEHVLGLPERPARHVGHADGLLPEGVDRDIDRAAGFDLDTPFGQLVEDDAPGVGRDEKRVVHMQLEVVRPGDAAGFVERRAREVGHDAACSVARAGLHDEVRGDGHREDDRGDERKVPEQAVPPEPGEEILRFFHASEE